MTTPIDDDQDPIEVAEDGAIDFMVERSIIEIETALSVVHAEALAGDDAEARRLLANIHARIATYSPDLLARVITDLLDRSARRQARAVLDEFEADFALQYGAAVTPGRVSWWRRALGTLRRSER